MEMCEHGRVLIGSTCDQCHAEKARRRAMAEKVKLKYGKYMRECPYDGIDVYRVLTIFEVTDPAIQHAIKKLLCAGKRGGKDTRTDIRETIIALERWEEMRREEDALAPDPVAEMAKSI